MPIRPIVLNQTWGQVQSFLYVNAFFDAMLLNFLEDNKPNQPMGCFVDMEKCRVCLEIYSWELVVRILGTFDAVTVAP